MTNHIEYILDLARWAPSGDNEQPWRFEQVNDQHFIVHGRDTRDWCVYDLNGRASQIAIGALLQNIEIAASGVGCTVNFSKRQGMPDDKLIVDVYLTRSQNIQPSDLLPFIEKRVTQRRALSTKALTTEQKQRLEASLGDGYQIAWVEGSKSRWQLAKLLFKSAYIRLTIPEAYKVHRQNIEWNAQYSKDKIPDQAIGADKLTLKIMRWALKSWRRVKFMNRYCFGTLLPRLQMDLLPGYRCGAHFMIQAGGSLETVDDFFEGGKAVQRFWLTAAQLGLQFQPQMTPLIFSQYTVNRQQFTCSDTAISRAEQIRAALQGIFKVSQLNKGVFMGRLGQGEKPKSRSIRQSIIALSYKNEN